MNTGVVTTSFPRFPGDFAGCFVEDAARACVHRGEAVEVIAAGPVLKGNEAAAGAHESGMRVVRIAGPALRGTPPLFFGDGAPESLEQPGVAAWAQAGFFWAGLCEEIRRRAPGWDRIVAHWLVPCGLAARAVAPHLPLTAYAHSGDVALLERIPGGDALGRILAGGIDDLVFVSRNLQQRFARLTGTTLGRVERLRQPHGHNFAAGDASARRAARVAVGFDCPFVLSVGRLVAIKGFDVLLQAMAHRQSEGVAISLVPAVVILGEGPERMRLESLARRLGVDLFLPGTVPREHVSRWMAAASVYVQPSRPLPNGRTEGLPVATLEALAAGLPVIASSTGGLAELHDQSQLRLVPPGEARTLSSVLVETLARPAEAAARACADPVWPNVLGV